MAKIDPFRMLGRFDTVLDFLMAKYNLFLEEEIPDYPTLFLALSNHVNQYDRGFCLRIADASAHYVEETKSTTLNQFQADSQKSHGAIEALFIFKKYENNYADRILEERDYNEEMEEEEKHKKREAMRNWFVFLAIVAVIFASIVIYNLPYFAEKRAYARVVEAYEGNGTFEEYLTNLDQAVSEYIEKYPEGDHFTEVAYMPVKAVNESYSDPIIILDAVDNYLQLDPKGKYAKECKQISDKIWNEEINKYEKKAADDASKKGADYIIAMMHYMRDNNVRTVRVVSQPRLNVRDYVQYPHNVRLILEDYYNSPNKIGLRLPDDMITITDKISVEDLRNWSRYVTYALQDGFDNVLTPGFIKFENEEEQSRNLTANYPVVTVNFSVYNQEETDQGYIFPVIWERSNPLQYYGDSKMILGIEIVYNALFSFPGDREGYEISGSGGPGENSIEAENPESAYETMCERSMRMFAEKVADEFGLDSKED